jgi:hypothetical protein
VVEDDVLSVVLPELPLLLPPPPHALRPSRADAATTSEVFTVLFMSAHSRLFSSPRDAAAAPTNSAGLEERP